MERGVEARHLGQVGTELAHHGDCVDSRGVVQGSQVAQLP